MNNERNQKTKTKRPRASDRQASWYAEAEEDAEETEGTQVMFDDEPYKSAVLGYTERRLRRREDEQSRVIRNMPPVVTCTICALTYYQTSAPHVCARWTAIKENVMQHENQITDYPKGARVEAVTTIACHAGPIPPGTEGTVSTHTLDGRAYVFFDGFDAGHTFHYPERFIRVVPARQPTKKENVMDRNTTGYPIIDGILESIAPTTEQEHQQGPVARGGEDDDKWIDTLLDTVAHVQDLDRRVAARLQIKHAINQHHSLLAERERLRETLSTLREMFNHLTLLSSVAQCHAQAKVGTRVIDAALSDQRGG